MICRRAFTQAAGASLLTGAVGAVFPEAIISARGGLNSAFIVGVNGYTNFRRLETAAADAKSMAERFTSFGYGVTHLVDPDTKLFNEAFAEFLRSVRDRSMVTLYLAGHGVQVAGRNYFLPGDAPTSGASGIAIDTMLAALGKTGIGSCALILDACRNDPKTLNLSNGASGLASMGSPGGFYIAYSAGADQTALDKIDESDRSANGLYCRYLLKHLNAHDAIDKIFKLTSVDVSRVAAPHMQQPGVYDQAAGSLNFLGENVGLPVGRSGLTRLSEDAAIENCAALVVGVDHFEDLRFGGAIHDARNMAATLSDHGIDQVELLFNPSVKEFREGLAALAGSGKRKIIYFAGPGVYCDGEGYIFLSAKNDAGQVVLPTSDVGISVGEIAARFDTPHDGTQSLLLLDTGLPQYCIGLRPAPRSLAALTKELSTNPFEAPAESKVSILYACNFHQGAADNHPGAVNSPFEIALTNALLRPGLTLDEIGDFVRNAVEQMTSGMQTPLLIASVEARKSVWVTRS